MSESNEASVQSVVHTPGPWKVSRTNRSVLAGGIKINQSSGPCAASAGVQIAIDRELQANAKLIAAAPDMLKTLRACVAWFEDNDLDPCVLDDVKDAIKKATGEQV